MKVLDDKMEAFTSFNGKVFIKLGLISDDFKRYLVFIDPENGKVYIEEIHAKQTDVTTYDLYLHQIDNDEEWKEVYKFITTKTTILSKKRIGPLLELNTIRNRNFKGDNNGNR